MCEFKPVRTGLLTWCLEWLLWQTNWQDLKNICIYPNFWINMYSWQRIYIFFGKTFIQTIWKHVYSKYYDKTRQSSAELSDVSCFQTPWPSEPSREGRRHGCHPSPDGLGASGTGKEGCLVAKPHYMFSLKGGARGKGVVVQVKKGRQDNSPVLGVLN